ncbi:hypothetical protein A3B02_02405 [Candidatus Roizmanbacteria bacterium RIFCSPLOWO2_01_FULL_42_14]|uniref:PLD phosphodiesterase domain-containing protein n=2 Tax=Candidatus Roizmaniibacteriota TaxID=1752723 RepID=A0A1F7J831_9BACT|nr:MAG: hypothetical protein A3B02_02405 [Candidatus Roizmanbacteria bacterium RIFCSPLOWO2_01_FULL_42_14]
MFSLPRLLKPTSDLLTSKLFDEKTFYKAFIQDLDKCKKDVIIESPYITCSRMEIFKPVFKKLLSKKVKIFLITRDPMEHDENIRHQATNEILESKEMGINITLFRGNHHRKLAILDKKILWEGSLNILSQTYSCEIMRRIESKELVKQMYNFLGLKNII